MSIYRAQKGLKGSKLYRKDGHLIKTDTVPGNIVALLETQDEVDDTNLHNEAPLKKCVFCGMGTKFYRQANGQALAVCENHYHNSTLGQTVQQARVNEEAKV